MEKKFEEELKRYYRENTRKDKLIVAQGVIIITLLVLGVIYLTYQTRTWEERLKPVAVQTQIVKQEISDDQLQELIEKIKPEDGRNGTDGKNGNHGNNGLNGSNGSNATAEQIATAVAEYMKLNPVTTLVGAKGDKGERQETTIDYETCELLSKYSNQDVWTIIAKLPMPCNP